MTYRALFQVVLADVSAFVADGIRDVEREVVATLDCRHLEKLAILRL